MIFREHVRWEMLRPEEFLARQNARPVVYLPMGLCEPHGHVAPFGLDTIKADWLCDVAAERFGGIVVPTMAYHVHSVGYHAPWLRAVMGGVNPRLAALRAHLLLETLFYQFRAFRNAGRLTSMNSDAMRTATQSAIENTAPQAACGFAKL